MALTSLARKFSSLPTPRTSGLPRRAPTMKSGMSAMNERDAISADDLLAARARQRFDEQRLVPSWIGHADRRIRRKCLPMKCASTSVSVSEVKL